MTAATTFAPTIADDWWGLLTYPNVAVQSIMACRIFRELKLGAIEDPLADDMVITTPIQFASATSVPPQTVADEHHSSETISDGTNEILGESGDDCQMNRDVHKV